MSSVNSTNTSSFYNMYGVKNSGIGGLASGLNTDEIVQSLTAGTRSKIGKQTQQKTMLQWQQTAYRSVTNVLSTFQSKHLGVNNTDSILMSSFWKTYKATATSDKISFISGNTSNVGSVEIKSIDQLSTKQTIVVDKTYDENLISKKDVELDAQQFFGKYLEIQVGNRSYNVRLDDMGTVSPPTMANYETALQNILNREVGTYADNSTNPPTMLPIIDVDIHAGTPASPPHYKFELKSSVSTLRITTDCDELGFDADQRNSYNLSTTVQKAFNLTGDEYTFSINGVEMTVTKDTTINKLMDTINKSACGATLSFDDKQKKFVFTAQAYGSGNNIVIKDIKGNLMNSFAGAATTTISSTPLPKYELGYKGKIECYNDSVDVEQWLDDAIANSTDIILQMTLDDPPPFTIRISHTDIDNAKQGLPPNDGKYDGMTEAAWLQKQLNDAIAAEFGSEKAGFTFTKNSDGSFKIELATNGYTEVFIHQTGSSATEFDLFDELFFDTSDPSAPTTLSNLGDSTLLTDLFPDPFGVFYLKDYQNNDVAVEWGGLSGVTNLRELLKAMNEAFGATDRSFATLQKGRIVLDSGDYVLKIWEENGAGGTALQTLFGDSMVPSNEPTGNPPSGSAPCYTFDGSPDPSKIDSTNSKEGLNAVITTTDGEKHVSHSNTFEIDGIAFEVNALTVAADGDITLTVRMDTDELVDKIQNFIDEYNALIYTLNAVVNEKKVDGYAPLTDEQRAEMSEDQIKTWESEAKKGILFNDSTVRTIIDELRQMVNKKVGDSGISLFDIGISVSSYESSSSGKGFNMDKAGTLQIDYTKLRNAIETNPDAVRVVFSANPSKYDFDYNTSTGKYNEKAYYNEQGIASGLYDAINNAIFDSIIEEDRGTLIALAGKDKSSIADETTIIGKKIQRIDDYINTLKIKLQNEYDRHWKKFSNLETSLQRMSAQSSWLNEFYA